MESLLHRSPSAGSIIKKITTLNPDLNVNEIIQIIKQSVETQSVPTGEFSGLELINEDKALGLTRATLSRK